ncbi:YidB family protein [Methylobacterium sp. ARG-1]|uniref:YidB family protein n=1 Tax=Methylobacterium sp. ARG-1 TaxID=1692501 RepID=UPI00068011A0|nr:YidB family protein [Methylobacterium sp. ARG-1]KNY23070.1 hypothetical protein AKJ13_09345 [Methylobacterium sp. ARG-1]
MSDGYPSMTALLGLLAMAGYQNRDKLAELLGGVGQGAPAPSVHGAAPGGQGGQGGALGGGLGGLLGNQRSAGPGGFLNSGLGEMLERFHQAGHGPAAQSWVNHGPNQEIAPHDLEQAIGPDVLATLTQRTGLSRDELLSRLTRDLPQSIDRYTPDGRIPV